MADAAKSRRRLILETLIALGAGSTVHAFSDQAAWQAYEAVEEAWLRNRHELLMQQAPAAMSAAAIDLEIRLTYLKKRAMEFQYLQKAEPPTQRIPVWQFGATQLSSARVADLQRSSLPYRKCEERIRQLTDMLRHHPEYEILRRAQIRLWKTPDYREAHRRYMGRLQELQKQEYEEDPLPPSTLSVQ